MSDYKLILTDVDGTLLNDDLQITPATKAALRRADSMGIRVVICTGRFPAGITHLWQALELKPFESCLNGALIKDGNTYLNNDPYPDTLVKIVVENLRGTVDEILAFSENRYAICSNEERWQWQAGVYGGKYGIRTDFSDLEEVKRQLGEPILKVLVKDREPNKITEAMKVLAPKTEGLADLVQSLPVNIEVNKKGMNKGVAVDVISKYYGIPKEQIIAFGDWDNDIPLIQKAGMGVAMGNASPALKACANYITTTNNDDGLAKALDALVFH